jgi:CheY-like chemotaxis protein
MAARRVPSILLIEDDHEDIEIFNEILSAITKNVLLTTVQDGNVALRILYDGSCDPDIIFLDLKIPSKDGLDILKEIQSDGILKKIPVVILSSVENPLILEKCKQLGIVRFVPKSPDASLLTGLLNEWMKTFNAI